MSYKTIVAAVNNNLVGDDLQNILYAREVTDKAISEAIRVLQQAMLRLNWSQGELARRAQAFAADRGVSINLSQQSVGNFLTGNAKRVPAWLQFVVGAIDEVEGKGSFNDRFEQYKKEAESIIGRWVVPADEEPSHIDRDEVSIQQWDVAYGMGGGTYLDLPVTGETHTFSRSWLRQFTHAPPDRVFIASGTGDSMMPTILDADIVLVDTTQHEVRMSDRIWAATYGQTGIIKRLRPMPDGSVKIISDNPAIPAETAYDGELSVVGRVVAIIRKT